MNTTKTFEELLQEATQIADARKKIFYELKSEIEKRFLPALVTVINSYDLKYAVLDLDTKPIAGLDGYSDYNTESTKYALAVRKSGFISEADYEYSIGQWEVEEFQFEINQNWSGNSEGQWHLLNSGAIELAIAIRNKIAELNKKYAHINESAESIIKSS